MKIMKEISGKINNSRYFKIFCVMLLIFALVVPCMNGIRIRAHADETKVLKIYAKISDEQPTEIELVEGSGSPAGKELIGKFITGGSYTLTGEDEDKLIIADNAEVTAGGINVGEFKLSGNSSLKYRDYTLASTEERFRSYPVTAGAITVEGLEAHYGAEGTPYFVDPERQIWSRSYDLIVNGNMTIAGFPEQDPEDPENQWISPFWIGYNDITVTETGNISILEGGHLLVEGSLTVQEGGTITGEGGDHYLRICSDAVISGLPLFAPTPDDNVSGFFAGSEHKEYEFRYDSEAGKWVYPFDIHYPVFFFGMGGYDFEHEIGNVKVQYKFSPDGAYVNADTLIPYNDGVADGFAFSLIGMPENTESFFLKVTYFPPEDSLKTMLCWWETPDADSQRLDGISGNVFAHEFNLRDFLDISLGYPDSGNPAIIDTANDYLYAYVGTEDEIKTYLATELYNRFIEVPMFENFGLGNAGDLVSRITKTDRQGSINVIDKEGKADCIPVNDYEVRWGYDQNTGDPVVSTLPVYTLPDPNDFLICTDFNKGNGTGTTFYIRKANADEIPFDGVGGYAIPVVVESIDQEKIVAGGMGGDTAVSNSDNIFTFSFNSRWLNSEQERGASSENDPVNYGTLVRVMIESETYVILDGEGETKRYGGLNVNGYNTDTVWNTRIIGDSIANVYIGHNTLHLKSLAPETGIPVREITAVELEDESLAAGVHIDADDMSDIKITFDSNFYATIPLNITYSDGKTKKLTINRVGLVIQYQFLHGDPNMDSDVPDKQKMGSDNTDQTAELKYDYFAGEQIVVYGIYYTPTNDPTGNSSDLSLYLTFEDGEHRVVSAVNNDILTLSDGSTVERGFDGRLAATEDSVATTIFLIGFAHAKEFDGTLWVGNETDTYYYDEGNKDHKGFYASVLNAGWDDDDSFGGTQVGSGKGIYWDGHISWY